MAELVFLPAYCVRRTDLFDEDVTEATGRNPLFAERVRWRLTKLGENPKHHGYHAGGDPRGRTTYPLSSKRAGSRISRRKRHGLGGSLQGAEADLRAQPGPRFLMLHRLAPPACPMPGRVGSNAFYPPF